LASKVKKAFTSYRTENIEMRLHLTPKYAPY
jgi:hypothetical protein